jgi:phage gpG-like protein
MAGVRGDFAGLSALISAVGFAQAPAFRAQLAQGMGVAAMKQLADEFQQSRDPYGKPWAPLKLRRGKPLLATGRLRASAALLPRPGGFEIVMSAEYARTHQEGRSNIRPVRAKLLSWKVRGSGKRYFAKSVTVPQRMMLPAANNLGPYWSAALNAEAERRVRELFSGGRKA